MKEFKKSDLKNRMVVEYRNGDRRLIVGDILLGDNNWSDLSQYNDNLKCTSCRVDEICSDYDIMKVFPEIWSYNKMKTINKSDKPLWERQKVKEITMAELEKMFGCKVKIVKEK